jgi:hypothetical protein
MAEETGSGHVCDADTLCAHGSRWTGPVGGVFRDRAANGEEC